MAATVSDRTVSIVPLNEKNFATWKIQMKMTLMREQLWGIVSGTEVAPTGDAATAEATGKFIKRGDRALSMIVLAIQPTLLYLVGDPTDPKVVYDKLAATFQKKTWSNKLRLRKTLYGMKLNAGMTVHQLLKTFIEIFEELAIIGEAVDDEDKVIHLLSSLPDEYSTLVTAMEAQDRIPSWESVQEKLLHEELKLNHKFKSHESENALSSKVNGKPNKKSYKCYECGKVGHIRKNCYVFLKKNGESKDGKANAAEVNNSEYDSCGLINVLSACNSNNESWILDSGATRHMSNDVNSFVKLIDLKVPLEMKVGDGRIIKATGIGNVVLNVSSNNNCALTLKNALFVPKLKYNLVSIGQLSKEGYSVNFIDDSCKIMTSTGGFLASGEKVGELYCLCNVNIESLYTGNVDGIQDLWHKRFCHINGEGLKKLVNENLVTGIDANEFKNINFCEPCAFGKNHRLPFPKKSSRRAQETLELIHSDVCGKISVPSLGGKNYFVTFIDDCTRFVWVYLMKTKDEVYQIFREWKSAVEIQTGKKVKGLRSDNGGEYTSDQFKSFLRSEGVKHELTVPRSPEQNGTSERMNRTLVEAVRTMIHDANLPKKFWGEAISTAVYVRNRSPTSALVGMTPYEALNGVKPDVKHLRSFGCVAYCHVSKELRRKLDSKSVKCMFLGYSLEQKGYRLFDPDKQKVFIGRDIIFNEGDRMSPQKEGKELNNESFHDPTTVNIPIAEPECESQQQQQQRPMRTRRPPNRYGEWTCVSQMESEPQNFQEATTGNESPLWSEAMQYEMDSMDENKVWNLTELPVGSNVIKSKWLYSVTHEKWEESKRL